MSGSSSSSGDGNRHAEIRGLVGAELKHLTNSRLCTLLRREGGTIKELILYELSMEGLSAFSLPALERFKLSCCQVLKEKELVAFIMAAPSLKQLDLAATPIKMKDTASFNLPNLEALYLNQCWSIKEKNLANLLRNSVNNIRFLNLSHVDLGLTEVSKVHLPFLETLVLESCLFLYDEALGCFMKMAENSLKTLCVSSTNISMHGLGAVKMPHLQEIMMDGCLSLEENNLTQFLQTNPGLMKVWMRNTKIKGDSVMAAFPDRNITWTKFKPGFKIYQYSDIL